MKTLHRYNRSGSAFIMAVVLVSLLAVMGALFLFSARLDSMSTGGMQDSKQLDSAVDTVIADISSRLAADVPRFDYENNIAIQEYYDYPDKYNSWLACTEPNLTNPDTWRRVTNLYDYTNVDANDLPARPVPEYQPTVGHGGLADADGDGITDSLWVRVPDVNTGGGEPIYAAVRIIDNSGMLNVNTAYEFDPNSIETRVDGTDQSQINLMGLSHSPTGYASVNDVDRLVRMRLGDNTKNEEDFSVFAYDSAILRNEQYQGVNYFPFDISDELDLRYRYLLDDRNSFTRFEGWVPGLLSYGNTNYTPFSDKLEWQYTSSRVDSNDYDYRHLATTYNRDRTIDPNGDFQLHAEEVDPNYMGSLLNKLNYSAPNNIDLDERYAQVVANIIDYGDNDSNVTAISYEGSNNTYYGFERPCIFISELVCKIYTRTETKQGDPGEDVPTATSRSYAVEICKLPSRDRPRDGEWVLRIPNLENDIELNTDDFGSGRYSVLLYENPDPNVSWDEDEVQYNDIPEDGAYNVDPNITLNLNWSDVYDSESGSYVTPDDYNFYLGEVPPGADANQIADIRQAVSDGNTAHPDVSGFEGVGNSISPGLKENTTYFWKADGFLDGELVFEDEAREFTTWNEDPTREYVIDPGKIIFDAGDKIQILRNGVQVDVKTVPGELVSDANVGVRQTRYTDREITYRKWVKRLWRDEITGDIQSVPGPTLGYQNRISGELSDQDYPPVRAMPGNSFRNVGEIGLVFNRNPLIHGVGWGESDMQTKLDLTDPNMQRLFKYLKMQENIISSAVPPKVKGRININTAPWYVIAQLPWVSQHTNTGGYKNEIDNRYALARAIVAYRDKLNMNDMPESGGSEIDYSDDGWMSRFEQVRRDNIEYCWRKPGFTNIAELNCVVNTGSSGRARERNIWYYGLDGSNQRGYPDLTVSNRTQTDSFIDDTEERNLIFSRISDLVTVRSDVFTAYITVRLGRDGPQRRVIAILDRSNALDGSGEVEVIATQPVSDPR